MGCDTARGDERPKRVGRWRERLRKEGRGWTYVAEARPTVLGVIARGWVSDSNLATHVQRSLRKASDLVHPAWSKLCLDRDSVQEIVCWRTL